MSAALDRFWSLFRRADRKPVSLEASSGRLRDVAHRYFPLRGHANGRRYLEAALERRCKDFGESDQRTLAARVDLANQLREEGYWRAAHEHYEKALYWFRRWSGEQDPNVLALEFAEAQCLRGEGDLASARGILQRVCAAQVGLCGLDNPTTLLYFEALAAILVRLGDSDAARRVLLPVLKTRREGTSNHDMGGTLSMASVLVTGLLNRCEWRAALPVQEEIFLALEKRRGLHDPETLLAGSLLATILIENGSMTNAKDLLESIATPFVQMLGERHRETLNVLFLLGAVLAREGDDRGARSVLEGAYRMAWDSPVETDLITVRLGTELGVVLLRLHDFGTAREILSALLPECSRLVGEDGSETLTNMNNLAVAVWEQGDAAEALTLQEELLFRKRRKFGAEHEQSTEALITLGTMCWDVQRRQNLLGPGTPHKSRELAAEVTKRTRVGDARVLIRMRGFQITRSEQR